MKNIVGADAAGAGAVGADAAGAGSAEVAPRWSQRWCRSGAEAGDARGGDHDQNRMWDPGGGRLTG